MRASRDTKQLLCVALAILTTLSPLVRPLPAHGQVFLLPTNLWYGPNFDAEQIFAATGPQRTALLNLQRKAVENTLRSHGLPASDFDAAQTWGRSDALFELWGLLVKAIKTSPCAPGQTPGDGCRTLDEQHAVDWLAVVAQRQAVRGAVAAGLEYVRWAGLNPDAYRGLIDRNASEGELTTFLRQGFDAPKNYARGFNVCPQGERCVQYQGISYTEGFCVYRPPAPYTNDYSDYGNILCTQRCPQGVVCTPFGPSYDDLTKWGTAAAANTLFDIPSFRSTLHDVAIGIGFGAGAGAVVVALSLTTLAFAVPAVGVATGAAATAIFPFAASAAVAGAAAASLILAVVVAAVVAGVYAVLLFQAEAVPGQLAKFIAGAPGTPVDLSAIVDDAEKAPGLYSLFIAATEPAPKPGVCAFGGVDGRPCLNAPPIPAVSPLVDPVFAVSLNSGTAAAPALGEANVAPTITWKDATNDTSNTARLSGHWFIQQSTGATGTTTVQTLRMHYTDWRGIGRTAWLTNFPTQGYRFVGVVDSDGSFSVRPETCLQDGTCSYSRNIEYVGTDGRLYSAHVIPPPQPLTPTVNAGYSPSSPYEGQLVTFTATGSSPLGEVVSYDWQISCPPEPGAPVGTIPQCFFTPFTTATGATIAHRFPMGGSYYVEVTATDETGASSTTGFRVLVTDVPPLLDIYPACPPLIICPVFNVLETPLGSPTTLNGKVIHAGSGDTVMVHVDWGDGTPAELATLLPPPAAREDGFHLGWSATHTYKRRGSHVTTVTIRDQTGYTTSGQVTETVVGDSPLKLGIYPACPPLLICLRSNVFDVPLGSPTFLNGDILPVEDTDTHSVYVDWGDGTVATRATVYPDNAYTPPGDGVHVPFTSGHVYAAPGTFTATVLVTDQTGETTMTEVTEHVVGTEPTATPVPTPMQTAPPTPTGGTPLPASTPVPAKNTCDAGKIACVKTKLGCLLKEHANAEGKGEAPDPAALQRCANAFAGCVGKVENKQKPEKLTTVCSVTGDTAALQAQTDAFVTDVVTAVHPSFPTVGPPSSCDAGKKKCVAQHASCILSERGKAAKSGAAPQTAKLLACDHKLDGGSKGFARGCIGKLEGKQNAQKPKTACSVTSDLAALQQRVDAFVEDLVAAIQGGA